VSEPALSGLVVQKYGGSSLASPERIRSVAEIACAEKRAGRDVIVVVSAMGNTTDRLVDLARTVSSTPSKRELDMLLTAGERISMALLSMAISDLDYQGRSFTGSQSGIVTDTVHTRAKILNVRAFRVKEELDKGRIVIVAGFQGVSSAKEVTTLGRGGSDTTAVALAAAFRAEACEIYTDVEGVFTADPELVPEARKLGAVGYDDMLELSLCGAGVLHWRSIDVARRFGVRIHVRSSFNRKRGTMVTSPEEIELSDILGIAHDDRVVCLRARDCPDPAALASDILAGLEKVEVSVRFMSVTPAGRGKGAVSIVVPAEYAEPAGRALEDLIAAGRIEMDRRCATVSVVGQGLSGTPGVARRVLDSLRSLGIPTPAISISGMSLTAMVERSRVEEAVRHLHQALGLDKEA
jgi:aspartate kinase